MFRTRPLTVAALAIALMPAVAVGGQTGTGGPEAHTVARAAAATQAESAPSHRLIVQLSLPALSEWARAHGAVGPGGRIDLDAPAATAHLERLRAERRAFVKALAAVPGAGVGRFVDENGRSTPLEFEIAYNGVAVDAGRSADLVRLERALRALPGVRGVHPDLPHGPSMYSSLGLIQASKLWSVPAIGGIAHAGEGVKVASVDGGIHHGGVMFDGTGYTYPPGYPLGYADNTNGKIIASRAYFRSWDPPAAGEGFPWPGPTGTSHGQHTASTAVGNPTEIDYHGNDVALSGVAPRAYAMSYRVFYGSVQGIGSFYTAEGIAALEDVVRDGADVVNNSWGGGATSQGGIGDPLDSALVGVWRAGVFVSMSEGNGGPNLHTGDHPSEDYVNVANSTTSGAFQESRDLSVTAPEPVPGDHQRIVFGLPADDFGPGVEVGRLYGPLPYKTSASVAPENEEGCSPFPAGAFDGSVALVMRGTCQFGVKALNAEQAGAGFVVIYNNQANGDTLSTMSAGDVGAQVTVPVVLIGRTPGLRLVAWHAAHAADARLSVGIFVRQVGNTPDIINAGSSRGPAVGDRLKPDIAAPGTNILAQGFADAPGEDTHLGFGQGTGTSMAAPHVAGAAALVRQLHPDWTPAEVKSALMSTARFRDIYVDAARTVPAQPLDMGAGRLDLEHAGDPGVLLSPPSLSFGRVPRGGRRSIVVRVRSVADAAEQYALSSVDVSGGFTSTAAVAGLTIEPATLSLEPGATGAFTVTWDSRRAAIDYGHNQGYVLLSGSAHQAHMPAWMQIAYPRPRADVLVLDNDGSALSAAARTECTGENPPPSYPDFGGVYTRTLEALGVDFEVLDVDARVGVTQAIPDANELLQYRAVVHQTGNNPCPVLGSADQQRLIEYANHEGAYIGFGQDLSQVLGSADSMDPTNGTTFYNGYLGAEFLQDSVNANEVFTDTAQLLYGVPYSPLAGKVFDISARGDGAGNQEFVDEIRATRGRATVRGTPSDTTPLLQYVGTHAVEDGLVALTQRERPTLEYPAVAWLGRTTYFAFGLEGVSDDTGYGTRAQLLDSAVRWMLDEPTAVITAQVASAHEVTTFSVEMSSVVADLASLRWDFGDGTPFAGPVPVATAGTTAQPHAGHVYRAPGLYDVRVEATNVIGSRAIGRLRIEVPAVSAEHGYIDRYTFLYLPAAWRGGMP